MAFTMRFKTDNAAFEGADGIPETVRLLRECANQIERGDLLDAFVVDLNGNRIGSYCLELEADPNVCGECGETLKDGVCEGCWTDEEEDVCSECGAALDDGEGYDGKCGSCADEAEEEKV